MSDDYNEDITLSMNNKRKYGSLQTHGDNILLLSSNQRSSQACDRCRLKKIKCDGLKPSCTSCKKVGYYCESSDKLTRRGFPRGYTEMLEKEVVRLQRLLGMVDSNGNTVANTPYVNDYSTQVMINKKKNIQIDRRVQEKNIFKQQKPLNSNESLIHGCDSQLPFINDSFHYYSNYIDDGTYLGNCSWNMITKDSLDLSPLPSNDESLVKYLLKTFEFENGIPLLLIKMSSTNDILLIKSYINTIIDQFFQNSNTTLIPCLYGQNWKKRLSLVLNNGNIIDPVAILVFIFICQWSYSCFLPELLYTITKMVTSTASDQLSSLQLLLLSVFYFMSMPKCLTSDNKSVTAWVNNLLQYSASKVVAQGLFINYRRLIPLQQQEEVDYDGVSIDPNHELRLVTFWAFQFLDIWNSVLQGLPKTNFLIDEFQPPSISTLNVPVLRPFQLLLEFILRLDGCNLLHILKTNNKVEWIQIITSFKHILYQWKLYHKIQDHDLENLVVNNNDKIEVMITLMYLLPKFLVEIDDPNSHETAYEILSLYYLLLRSEYTNTDSKIGYYDISRLLPLLHLIPIDNMFIIELCLHKINESQVDALICSKYRLLISSWMALWFVDSPILHETLTKFKIKIKRVIKLKELISELRNPQSKQLNMNLPFSLNISPHIHPLLNDSLATSFPKSQRILLKNDYNNDENCPGSKNPFDMFSNLNVPDIINGTSNSVSPPIFPTVSRILSTSPHNTNLDSLRLQEFDDDDGYVEDDESEGTGLIFPFNKGENVKALFDNQTKSKKLINLRLQKGHIILDHKEDSSEQLMKLFKDSTDQSQLQSPPRRKNIHYELVQDSSMSKEDKKEGTPRSFVDMLLFPATSKKTMPSKEGDNTLLNESSI